MKYTLLAFFMSFCFACRSQSMENSIDTCNYELKGIASDTVLVAPEQMPQFCGGETEMFKFIFNNLVYPTVKRSELPANRATVRFIVRKTGKVENVEAIGPHKDSELAKSLIKVVELMPDWCAGKDKGKPVDAYFTLPLHVDYK